MWVIIQETDEYWYSIVEMCTDELEARKDAETLAQETGRSHWVVLMEWGKAYEKK